MAVKNNSFVYSELPEELTWWYKQDDQIAFSFVRNECVYVWTIPFKNYKLVDKLDKPFRDEELVALGAKVKTILVSNRYSIDFKGNVGVKKLDVSILSTESEDRQLLHKVSTEFRAKEKLLNNDSLVGTKNKYE